MSDLPAPRDLWPLLLQAPPWRDKQALPPVPALAWRLEPTPPAWHWTRAKAQAEKQTGHFHVYSSTWQFLKKPDRLPDWAQRAAAVLTDSGIEYTLARIERPEGWSQWPALHQVLWLCGVPADQLERVASLDLTQPEDFGPPPEALDSYDLRKLTASLPPRLALGRWQAQPDQLPGLDERIDALRLGGEPIIHTLLQTQRMASRDALVLAHGIEWTALVPWVANGLAGVRWRQVLAQSWLLSFPQTAALGLWEPALTPDDPHHAVAWQGLRLLHEHGHTATLQRSLRQGLAAQPEAEVQAAWDAALNRLTADPSRWLPTPLPKLPKALDQTLAASTAPLVLRQTGPQGERLVLPPEATRDALMVLMLGTAEAPYAGLAQLQAACTPESLAIWARDLFDLWAADGMPAKGRFLLHAQGWLGDDVTATRLHKGVVAWRARLDRVRAYEGIQALSRMGGKAALTWLAALADQKRYDDLRSRASEALQAAAESRGMSMEELADCTLPDLGFDSQSRQRLDFGPRQFEVLLDEQLQIRLRECAPPVGAAQPTKASRAKAGQWLKTLPKPRLTDDADLAAQAKRQLKDVQTQLKALSRRQLQRMEAAMCQERRWTLASFRANLVEHPLARVLTQRLIFGVYPAASSVASSESVVTPIALFRVAEDGTPANAQDDPVSWDDLAALTDADSACIGMVHPLALAAMADGAVQGQAFASQLADYELLQPFEQLGREVAHLPEALLDTRVLPTWDGRQLGTGSIMGLVSQGWQRQVGDGGMVDAVHLALPGQLGVTLSFEPGWFVAGGIDTSEGQTIQHLGLHGHVPHASEPDGEPVPAHWRHLSPIARSELLRSLNRLAWWERP
ncbi:hypothetical protein CCO03_09535 [Comamonas serinivorans]|uniref:DUF4132 domain-containing protein n=1 Tax=Comamonas serinivorans TaxID=1082851 RepID=A0A1Y0EN63_9BURK|nr:DUF4132 domain-containing protein [Comamonas serinivorans]ARU04890.1 hypothetical protein CCO03_09535 [Comamonas serinivorans]